MAAEPHHPGPALPPGPTVFSPSPNRSQDLAGPAGPTWTEALSVGPMRRLVFHSAVAGHVTCEAEGADVLGSAGVPLRTAAVTTALTADEARQHALNKGLARYAAGRWDAQDLSKHPPQAPHGIGPGPWVRMWVGDVGAREVWMPAARVYSPFRLANGRLTGDDEGLACAGTVEQARFDAQVQQVGRRAMLPLWQALERRLRSLEKGDVATQGARDVVVAHAHGMSLAISFQWSAAGPLYGCLGLGCAVDDGLALSQARTDRVHTEALLRLQAAGVWGEPPQDRPRDMDAQVHRLAWGRDEAMAMASLLCHWRARGRAWSAVDAAQRSGLAWADLTPTALREQGLWVVRALWLDGEGGALSRPTPLSPPR